MHVGPGNVSIAVFCVFLVSWGYVLVPGAIPFDPGRNDVRSVPGYVPIAKHFFIERAPPMPPTPVYKDTTSYGMCFCILGTARLWDGSGWVRTG